MKNFSLLVCLAGINFSAHSVDCKVELNNHLKTDLDLSYEFFDQTAGSGMRALAGKGCFLEAAELIIAYKEKNKLDKHSLDWHIAQMYATAGKNKEAVQWAKAVVREKEDFKKKPLRWNDYVLGTIAFLENDKEKLIVHRNNVAKGKEDYFGNEINLKFMDSMIRNFGKTYAFASKDIK